MSTERSRDQENTAAAEDAPEKPSSRFLFFARFARLPTKKLILLGSLAATGLLALIGIVVLAVSLIKKPGASAAPPVAPPLPPQAEAETPARPPGKPTVEERFEAIKRGTLSGIPRRQAEPAPQPSAVPPTDKSEPRSAPAINTAGAPAKTSPLTKQGGCEVGTADAKGSAASILDCIRYFNEVEGDARPKPTQGR